MEGDENQIAHLIEDGEENLDQDHEEDNEQDHVNVVPFRLIRLTSDDGEFVIEKDEDESVSGLDNIHGKFDTKVRGKYSKYYKQTYRPAWEHMPDFKGWLKGVKGQPTRAYCIFCQKTLHAHRLSLLKHTCTIRHQKAAQAHGHPIQSDMSSSGEREGNKVHTVIINEEGVLTGEESSNEPIQAQVDGEDDDVSMDHEDLDEEFIGDHDESITTNASENNQMESKNFHKIPPISTHVIDMTRGAPVFGLNVSLYKLVDGRWTYINEGLTNSKGRCSSFFKQATYTPGRYKLHYDVDRYFASKKQQSPFPFIETIFDGTEGSPLHFPLLIGPNNYSTYRSTFEQ
ncbi:hypothetical protein ABEB36_000569 [Hypothenemus hampei]|uniref:hydroxyisourate hydrolase n=1 Tax=Hypothenemus hampei TaxID=57062 RepID=A0ABD1FBN8_HYPHA